MSKLTEILHELASVTGRHQLHDEIDSLEHDATDAEDTAKEADETLTEGGK